MKCGKYNREENKLDLIENQQNDSFTIVFFSLILRTENVGMKKVIGKNLRVVESFNQFAGYQSYVYNKMIQSPTLVL